MHVDDLRAELNLPVEQVSAALALMELKGLVRHVGGMQYVALREEQADYQVGLMLRCLALAIHGASAKRRQRTPMTEIAVCKVGKCLVTC